MSSAGMAAVAAAVVLAGWLVGCADGPAGTDPVPTEAGVKITSGALRTYPLVDTGQSACFDTDGEPIDCPAEGAALYGQDAQFTGTSMSYTDNGDGTVTDEVTGLMWQQTPTGEHLSWAEAIAYCEALELGGYGDWRVPSANELFSLSDFSQGWPYIDTEVFDLSDPTVSKDEQYWTSTAYAGVTVEGRDEAVFGVNFGTGHIKAYPGSVTGPTAKRVRCVRGEEYGVNAFVDNGDGTVTDWATGLMWAQEDGGVGMDWEEALAWVQRKNAEVYLGYSDWRLPDVKELQSIVDYTRAPGATDPDREGPALDPVFHITPITNEAGEADYPYFWTSTSARFQACGPHSYAWYVAFGRAVDPSGADSHGAGAVRFDTKVEGGATGEGGERVYNFVRLVRGGDVAETPAGNPSDEVCDGSDVTLPEGPASWGGGIPTP
ncbi:Lcl C-terminal domain-containing protein [Deferrisoma palaeochoriense]